MDDHKQGVLPGFRFHPTDQELVSFYLRRKIEKKLSTTIDQFIKQMDIYKYDPWDLPKNSDGSVAEMEWYFFCKRGRKYRNSIRPNRVTGSGFWKATGIDKAIYSAERGGQCIGLKKSLVYYRGSAGKGTKTEWMMHEFRLPGNANAVAADRKTTTTPANANANDNAVDDQQVEVWTLCRIFKRNMSTRRKSGTATNTTNATATPADHWREGIWKPTINSSKPSIAGNMDWENQESYIWFGAPAAAAEGTTVENEMKAFVGGQNMKERKQFHVVSEPESCSSTVLSDEAMELFTHGSWEDIISAVDDFAFDPYHIF